MTQFFTFVIVRETTSVNTNLEGVALKFLIS